MDHHDRIRKNANPMLGRSPIQRHLFRWLNFWIPHKKKHGPVRQAFTDFHYQPSHSKSAELFIHHNRGLQEYLSGKKIIKNPFGRIYLGGNSHFQSSQEWLQNDLSWQVSVTFVYNVGSVFAAYTMNTQMPVLDKLNKRRPLRFSSPLLSWDSSVGCKWTFHTLGQCPIGIY